MLLVIFGAGASYDSVPHLPPPVPKAGGQVQTNFTPLIPTPTAPAHENDRPPLANQLFDGREIFVHAMDQFRDCKEIVPSLRKSGVSVEKELAKFQQQAATFPKAHQELAAIRYYLHVALWNCQEAWMSRHHGVTNYASVIREIERWRYATSETVCFVTFNYDTMLEQAMDQVLGFQAFTIDSYLQQNYALIKLHGSVNWGREINSQSALAAPHTYNPYRIIKESAILQISDNYTVVHNRPMNREGNFQRVVFPALSIPVEKKDEFNCPKQHVKRLKELLPSVRRIITIGWRATEADFLEMLGQNVKGDLPLMVVSGDIDGAKETNENLAPTGLGHALLFDGGFSGLILNHLSKLEEFLHIGDDKQKATTSSTST